MHKVLVNRLGGLSLPRTGVVRLSDRPHMTIDVSRGRKTITQQQQPEQAMKRLHDDKQISNSGISVRHTSYDISWENTISTTCP